MATQIFGSLFLIYAISRVIARGRDRTLSITELIIWMSIFGGILFFILDPSLSIVVAGFLGINRGADAIVYGSIAILFYLIFRTYVMLENLEHKTTLLVRELAILKSVELNSQKDERTEVDQK
jgi:hypothetical protein